MSNGEPEEIAWMFALLKELDPELQFATASYRTYRVATDYGIQSVTVSLEDVRYAQ